MKNNKTEPLIALIEQIQKGDIKFLPERTLETVNLFLKERGLTPNQQERWWKAFYKYWIADMLSQPEVAIIFQDHESRTSNQINSKDEEKLKQILSSKFQETLESFVQITRG